jgi:mono/diheme cytochrome c family protein
MKYAIGAILGVALFAWLFSVCSPAGVNKTGHEYMPDMYHPVSYEANQYSAYRYNHWEGAEYGQTFSKAQLSQPRAKVNATIPRGYTGVYYTDASALDIVRGKNAPNAIAAQINGEAPFAYVDTEEDRLKCEKAITFNPYPISKEGLDRAKPLYDIYCGVCHGTTGNGLGVLVSVPDAKYPAAPKNLLGDDMIGSGNGRYYFAMVYGKNVMGGYTDKISYEERWQVIHYIRSLQAKSKNLEYSEKSNSLSNIEKPAKGEATGPVRVAPAALVPAPAAPTGK